MNRGELRSWVRAITLVEEDDLSDDILNDYINAGLRELDTLNEWPFLQSSTIINLSAGQPSYTLPANFSSLIEVVIGEDGQSLTETTRSAAQRKYLGASNGTPSEYYLWEEKLFFVPTPSANPSFDGVVVDYYKRPTALSLDAASPEFHAAFHPLLAEYAISRVWEFYEDFDRSGLYYARYRNRVFEMALHYRNRIKDAPLIVGSTRLDDSDPQRPYMTWPHMG